MPGLTTEQFLGSATHLVSRLRDHIERLDEGAVTAMDDIAVVLRALVAEAKGCKVLHRLAQATRSAPPEIWLTPPALRGSDVTISAGSIPTDGAVARMVRGERVVVTDLRKATVFAGSGWSMTWDKFLRDYANKWGGAHLDQAIPDELLALETQVVGGLSMPGYVLRSAATAVWQASQTMLSQALHGNGDAARLNAVGGVEGPPRPLDAAELLQMRISKHEATMAWLVDEQVSGTLGTLRMGGGTWRISFQASHEPVEGPPTPPISLAPRVLEFPPPSFTAGKSLRLGAWIWTRGSDGTIRPAAGSCVMRAL